MSGCTTALGSISGTSTLQGTWTDECVSSNRRGTRYARYFTFELATAAELTIELVSEIDPYLYLMAGAGTSGTELAKNDDSRDNALGRYNSRIVYDAAAGTYTAEATTYGSMRTGDFTITIDAVPSIPSAPTNVSVVPGNNRLVVLWDAPASDGGSPVTGYRVEQQAASGSQSRSTRSIVDPSRLLGVDERGYAILDLTNGTSYSVTVKAVNANGDGAPSTALRRTPQENISISIGTVTPNPLVLARKATVNATTSNTVSGVNYSAELVIQDTDKIRFGDCDDDRSTQPLPNLGSTVRIQACETGTPTISARLLVSDAANRTYTIAESLPRRVTVDAASEYATVNGLADNTNLIIGSMLDVDIVGEDLIQSEIYDVSITTSEAANNTLGFSRNCAALSGGAEIEEGATPMNQVSFRLYTCGPIAAGTVNVSLSLDGVILIETAKRVKAEPAVPEMLMGVGRGSSSSSGRMTLRVEDPGYMVDYIVQYHVCDGTNHQCEREPQSWTQSDPLTPIEKQLTTTGNVSINAHEITVYNLGSPGVVYRVEVAANVGGQNGLTSDYTNNTVMVYTSSTPPGVETNTYPRIASVQVNKYWQDKTYAPVICEDTFNDHDSAYLPLVLAAARSWEDSFLWLTDDGAGGYDHLFDYSVRTDTSCGAFSFTHPDSSDQVRMAASISEFEVHCGADSPPFITLGCIDKRPPATNPKTIKILTQSPIFVRPGGMGTGYAGWLLNVGSSSCKKLTDVIAHEIGHAIGLFHSTEDHALMYVTPQGHCAPQPPDIVAAVGWYQSR